MTPDLSIYDQDRRWIGGGPVLAGLSRVEAVERVARYAASRPADPTDPDERLHIREGGRPALYKWSDQSGDLRPLPVAMSGPVEPVFAGDMRDRHLMNPPS